MKPQWCDKCLKDAPFVISHSMEDWRCLYCFGDAELPDNPLMDFVEGNINGRRITKWIGYLDVYHRHLQGFRGMKPTVLEIGVCHGGGMDMWKSYFGEGARIVGIDIEEPRVDCRDHEIHIGDQGNGEFLMEVAEKIGPIDIVIDDGGHKMTHMNMAFAHLFDAVNAPGAYIVEDLHTAFMPEYMDGMSFFNHIARMTEEISGWHREETPTRRMKTTFGVHAYESIVVFEKRHVQRPIVFQSGLEKGEDR